MFIGNLKKSIEQPPTLRQLCDMTEKLLKATTKHTHTIQNGHCQDHTHMQFRMVIVTINIHTIQNGHCQDQHTHNIVWSVSGSTHTQYRTVIVRINTHTKLLKATTKHTHTHTQYRMVIVRINTHTIQNGHCQDQHTHNTE